MTIWPVPNCFNVIMRSACCTRWPISGAVASVMFMCSGSATAGIVRSSPAANARVPEPAASTTRPAVTVPRVVLTAKPVSDRAMAATLTPSASSTPRARIQVRMAALHSSGLSLPSLAHNSAPTIPGPR